MKFDALDRFRKAQGFYRVGGRLDRDPLHPNPTDSDGPVEPFSGRIRDERSVPPPANRIIQDAPGFMEAAEPSEHSRTAVKNLPGYRV